MLVEERVLREVRADLEQAGLSAGILVRDLHTGRELGLDADRQLPLASVVKLPLAAAVLLQADQPGGTPLDHRVLVEPGARTSGPTGLSRFRHRAEVAVEDLVWMALSVSDNAAADVLFELVPPEQVTRLLRGRGHDAVTVRHTISTMLDSITARLGPDQEHLALALAARAATGEGGSLVPQLDTANANSGSARAMVDLLGDVWDHDEPWALRLRGLLSGPLLRHRLAPDLESDAASWSAKTGTFLTLRHEVGVLEHDDGGRFAVAVLSESRVPARVQPAAEMALGSAARRLHEVLRGS